MAQEGAQALELSLLRGRIYNRKKAKQGSNNQYVQASSENGQNVHLQSTSQQLAEQFNVNEKTIGLCAIAHKSPPLNPKPATYITTKSRHRKPRKRL